MCSLASFIASITVPFLALDIISLVHLWTRGMSGVDRPAHPLQGPIQPGLSSHLTWSTAIHPHPSMNPSMDL